MIRTRIALTAFTMLSSLGSFAAYTLLLRLLGASQAVDTLFYAASVPLSVSGVATGVLLYLLPPRFTQIEAAEQDGAARLLGGAVLLLAAAALAVAAVGMALGQDLRFWAMTMGYTLTAATLVLSTLTVCLAQARAQYLDTALSPLIISSGLLIGTGLAIVTRQAGWLIAGQLCGASIATAWLASKLGLAWQARWRDTLALGLKGLAPLRHHVLTLALGTTAFTLFQPLDAALCSLLGAGAVSVMSYAQRVLVAMSMAVSLGAHAIAARTSHDTLQAGGPSGLARSATAESLRIVGAGMASWAAYVMGGDQVLVWLFSSSAMSAATVEDLRACLSWMLLGVGPMAAVPYLFRVYYTLQVFAVPAFLGVAVPLLYGVVAYTLLPRFGIQALALAYATVWWTAVVLALVELNARARRTAAAPPPPSVETQ